MLKNKSFDQKHLSTSQHCTPFKLSELLLNNKLHKFLKLKEIPADEVSLKVSLLRK